MRSSFLEEQSLPPRSEERLRQNMNWALIQRCNPWERRPDCSYKIEPPPEYYLENRATLNLIRARIPESPLMEAYFQGNDKKLEAFIDHERGDGTWKKVRELLETAETNNDREALEKARELLKGRYNVSFSKRLGTY